MELGCTRVRTRVSESSLQAEARRVSNRALLALGREKVVAVSSPGSATPRDSKKPEPEEIWRESPCSSHFAGRGAEAQRRCVSLWSARPRVPRL